MKITILVVCHLFIALVAFIGHAKAQSTKRLLRLEIEERCGAWSSAYASSFPKEAKPKKEDDKDIVVKAIIPTKNSNSNSCNASAFRLPPQYPNDKRLRRIAPYSCVFAKFDVDTTGRPQNISIEKRLPDGESKKLNKFDKAGVSAIQNWCYAPKVEDGIVVEQKDVRTKLTFTTSSQKESWENPTENKDYFNRAKAWKKLSTTSCEEYSIAQREIRKNNESAIQLEPSAATFPGFVDAEPLKREPPSWPSEVSSAAVYHACTFARFDISAEGTPINIKILYRAPTDRRLSGFDKATTEAIKKWKYTPAQFNGENVEQRNVQTKLTFEIDDSVD